MTIDWESLRCDIITRTCGGPRSHLDWLEDAVQDALIAILSLRARGVDIRSPIAFGVTYVRRRWVDRARALRRSGLLVEALGSAGTSCAPRTDWAWRLSREGWHPTPSWIKILEEIARGTRGSKRMAVALERDTKSIREARTRLRKWLRRILLDVTPPPLKRLGFDSG